MRFILRGRRSIWWSWIMIPVAPRTVKKTHHISWHHGHITSQDITWHDTSQLTTFNVHHVTSQTTRLLHLTPQPTSWHQNRSNHHHGTSPPWNSRRLVHSKEMVWASRWSVALRAFYRQILSLLYSSFFFWNFRPRLARELLVRPSDPRLSTIDFPLNMAWWRTLVSEIGTWPGG